MATRGIHNESSPFIQDFDEVIQVVDPTISQQDNALGHESWPLWSPDLPGLTDDEEVLKYFEGRYLEPLPERYSFSRHNTIWLTSRRIIIQDTTYLLGFKVSSAIQSFKYRDIKNVSIATDYRPGILAATIGLWYLATLMMQGDGGFFVFWSIVFVMVSVSATILYLMRLPLHEELKLDFFKKETVNSWLVFRSRIMEGRRGSSITKSLMFSLHEISDISKFLYDHQWTDLTDSDVSLPQPVDNDESRSSSAVPKSRHIAPETAAVSNQVVEGQMLNQFGGHGLLPGETMLDQARRVGFYCAVNPVHPILVFIPIFWEFGSKHEEIVVTDRRIIITTTKRAYFCFTHHKRETFKHKDLKNVSIETGPTVVVVSSFSFFLSMSILFLLFGNIDHAFFVVGIIFLIIAVLLLVLSITGILQRAYLSLDFYKPEIVHSWLEWPLMAIFLRQGSSTRKTIRLPDRDSKRIMNLLYLHPRSHLTDDKDD